MKITLSTLKGFRDFLPDQERKRSYILSCLSEVFRLNGFEAIETPAIEYEELLTGKYGQEADKLIYRFVDNGQRKVALRYDQTVPLARIVSQYNQSLSFPFKRYQIQNVWRGDNPQKGRYREILHCDADIVGTSNPLSDAELIKMASQALEKLKFKNFKILINDRQLFGSLPDKIVSIIDKLKKTGRENVEKELIENKQETSIIDNLQNQKPTKRLEEIFSYTRAMGIDNKHLEFYPLLARGLNYYTSTIFEIEIDGYTAGSVGGGGRYDNLIKLLSEGKSDMPAVGFAFGVDRLYDALEKLQLFPQDIQRSTVKALVTVFNKDLTNNSIEILNILQNKGINTEIFDGSDCKLEKQLKYADKKDIPYAVILGPEEIQNNKIILRDMQKRTQDLLSKEDLIKRLNQIL